MKHNLTSLLTLMILVSHSVVLASPIIPVGNSSNILYYKIGGEQSYIRPPVQDISHINLKANVDLGLGYQCGMYNPALSIKNTLNNLQDNVNNLTQSIIANATGSIAEMPMYFLAQANPTLYHLLNNALVNAQTTIAASVKSCQETRNQIAQGKNPYQDWGTLAVGDAWKQHLSLTATGDKDINDAHTNINEHAGDNGIPWVQGKSGADGALRAGGQSQPPIHVIADTVKAGYNAMLNRDVNSGATAPNDSELFRQFSTPQDAVNWITNVLGDYTVTTCNDASCKNLQGGSAGRGLLPWATVCNAQNKHDCVDTIRFKLESLVAGTTIASKDNLLAVSADNLVISPQVISTLKAMDSTQQGIFIHKLAQDISTQRLMDKAFTARNLLQTGSQVPVIASNEPAQKLLKQAASQLDSNIESISFSSHIRKQMMSDTVGHILQYAGQQRQQAFEISNIHPTQPVMEDSAIGVTP